MDPTLVHLLEGALTAAVLSVFALLWNVRSQLIRIETLLTGANGDNGLVGDMRDLKTWRQDLDEYAIPHRLRELERRHGPPDRREATS